MKLLLASASPRRRELLQQVSIPFAVAPQDVDESVLPGEAPRDYVARVASLKADSALDTVTADTVVLAADTAVVAGGEILGKPTDRARAISMLRQLSGTAHEVLTAIALRSRERRVDEVVAASVWLAPLDTATIERYVDTGEPFDKAGSYGVQGIAGVFVERIEGSYTTVVGLPLAETETALQALGFDTWASR